MLTFTQTQLKISCYSDAARVGFFPLFFFSPSPKSQLRGSSQLENFTLTFSLLANLVEW